MVFKPLPSFHHPPKRTTSLPSLGRRLTFDPTESAPQTVGQSKLTVGLSCLSYPSESIYIEFDLTNSIQSKNRATAVHRKRFQMSAAERSNIEIISFSFQFSRVNSAVDSFSFDIELNCIESSRIFSESKKKANKKTKSETEATKRRKCKTQNDFSINYLFHKAFVKPI